MTTHPTFARTSILGLAQILVRGGSLFLMAVLADPVAQTMLLPVTLDFTLAAIIHATISVHLIALLQTTGLSVAAANWGQQQPVRRAADHRPVSAVAVLILRPPGEAPI